MNYEKRKGTQPSTPNDHDKEIQHENETSPEVLRDMAITAEFFVLEPQDRRRLMGLVEEPTTASEADMVWVQSTLETSRENTRKKLLLGGIDSIQDYLSLLSAVKRGDREHITQFVERSKGNLRNKGLSEIASSLTKYACYDLDERGWASVPLFLDNLEQNRTKSPERVALIERVVGANLEKTEKPKEGLPQFVLVAGLPGVGKSFFVDKADSAESGQYLVISPDQLKHDLDPNYTEDNIELTRELHDESCFVADVLQEKALEQQLSAVREVTFSHLPSILQAIEEAQKMGYAVTINFVHSDKGIRNNFAFRERSIPAGQYVKKALGTLKNITDFISGSIITKADLSSIRTIFIDNTNFQGDVVYDSDNGGGLEDIFRTLPQIEKLTRKES